MVSKQPYIEQSSQEEDAVKSRLFVVTPSFNSEGTISSTIKSVVSQRGNFEIYYHVQDAGSSDSTVAILQRWKEELHQTHPDTNVVHFSYSSEPDKGMYDAIVKAFEYFEGINADDWMTWINSDDFFEDGAFSIIATIDSTLREVVHWVTGKTSSRAQDGVFFQTDIRLNRHVIGAGLCDGVHWNFLQQEGTFFRNFLWEKIDKAGEFSNFKYAGDWNLWRSFSLYEDIYQVDNVLANFCKREGQLSQIYFNEYLNEIDSIVPNENRSRAIFGLNNNHYTQFKISTEDVPYTTYQDSVELHWLFRIKNTIMKSSEITRNKGYIAYDSEWQFPAITEQYSFERIKQSNIKHSGRVLYFAFPWATLIDLLNTKNPDGERLKNILNSMKVSGYDRVVTVCQHILGDVYGGLFRDVGITDVFWSHATNQNPVFLNSSRINIHPYPLFPVQAADIDQDYFDSRSKQYLFSFVGAKASKWYLTQVRTHILEFLSDEVDGFVAGRENWHYHSVVYEHQISKSKKVGNDLSQLIDDAGSEQFKSILRESVFTLCPSGSGPNSIRLWESIGYGSIPVILADTYLPPGDPALWDAAVVYCEETEEAVKALPERLRMMAADKELIDRKIRALRQLWILYGPDCFIYDILQRYLEWEQSTVPVSGKLKFKNSLSDLASTNNRDSRTLKTLHDACVSRLLIDPVQFQAQVLNCPKARALVNELVVSTKFAQPCSLVSLISQEKILI